MPQHTATAADAALAGLGDLLPDLQTRYTDVHAHPELSMEETRTAGLPAERMRAAGYEVTTDVGKTGVGVTHACGHDVHATWLVAAALAWLGA